jgi:hypothetical protein
VVGAVCKQDLVLTGVAHELAEGIHDPPHALLGVVIPREPGEVVVVRQHLAGDHLGRPGTPAEDDAESSSSSPSPREKRKVSRPNPARICGSCAGWPKLSGM